MKVLVVQGEIPGYRIPIFNRIAEKHELTVAIQKKFSPPAGIGFSVLELPVKKIRSINLHSLSVLKLFKQYDVVIVSNDLHYPVLLVAFFLPRRYALGSFGIGFRCSYTRRYDPQRKHTFLDWVAKQVLLHSDFNIFYMKENIAFWHNELPVENTFVAHNTVEILPTTINEVAGRKTAILFVGTLYKQKMIYELIDSYVRVKKKNKDFFDLEIVGPGPELPVITEMVRQMDLADCIHLHGPIYDEKVLKPLFLSSALCVSPNQAGLSVLKSLGYGVPFVTRSDAITGGERLNIRSGENGYFYDSPAELDKILLSAWEHPEKSAELSRNAHEYYWNHATPDKMAEGFLKAIEYGSRKKNLR